MKTYYFIFLGHNVEKTKKQDETTKYRALNESSIDSDSNNHTIVRSVKIIKVYVVRQHHPTATVSLT